jgi:Bax protein
MAHDETAPEKPHRSRRLAVAAGLAALGGLLLTLGALHVARLVDVASVVVPVLRPSEQAVVAAVDPVPQRAQPLLAWLRDRDYRLEDVREAGRPVPRVILTSLPDDLETMDSVDDRKALFVKAMLPLVLMVNEPIERDRARLEGLNDLVQSGVSLAPRDRRWVTELADRYGFDHPAATPLSELLKRVDVVPVSLAIAQAAEESGWGTSRIARAGNAVFGQQTWGEEGIVPQVRRPGETHKYQRFDTLLAGVRAYVHNLNTHDAYRDFRVARASLRQTGKPLDSVRLLSALVKYSERGPDYVQAVRTLIRSNDLQEFDGAKLHDGQPELVVHVDKNA